MATDDANKVEEVDEAEEDSLVYTKADKTNFINESQQFRRDSSQPNQTTDKLSTFLTYNDDEKKSVSIGLQTGDSIRGSKVGADDKQEPVLLKHITKFNRNFRESTQIDTTIKNQISYAEEEEDEQIQQVAQALKNGE